MSTDTIRGHLRDILLKSMTGTADNRRETDFKNWTKRIIRASQTQPQSKADRIRGLLRPRDQSSDILRRLHAITHPADMLQKELLLPGNCGARRELMEHQQDRRHIDK